MFPFPSICTLFPCFCTQDSHVLTAGSDATIRYFDLAHPTDSYRVSAPSGIHTLVNCTMRPGACCNNHSLSPRKQIARVDTRFQEMREHCLLSHLIIYASIVTHPSHTLIGASIDQTRGPTRRRTPASCVTRATRAARSCGRSRLPSTRPATRSRRTCVRAAIKMSPNSQRACHASLFV
jgi:hypothetical protein